MHVKSWQAIVFLAVVSVVLVLAEIPSETWLSTAAMSLSAGAIALALMAAAALLGGRWSIVESIFGGLDRVYLTHKWLGIWALAFASLHFVFPAELEQWDLGSIVTLPGNYRRFVRQLSLIALMVIIVLALDRKIPYSAWRWWHKLSGPLFLIVIAHWLSIESPIAASDPAGVWLATLSTLGVAAAAYKLLLYPFLSRHGEYRIVALAPAAGAIDMELEPVHRPIRCEPGQFGFLRIKEEGLREPHPFTLASRDESGCVRFVIRALGDYTQKLVQEAAVGMHADIYAPFGRFKRPKYAKREVWVAGGVGISPFISWLTDEDDADFANVTLFYFYTPGREFPKAEVLEGLARKCGAEFVSVSEGARSMQFTTRLSEIASSAGPADVVVSFCGPQGLLKRIREVMQINSIPERNLKYEYFEFR